MNSETTKQFSKTQKTGFFIMAASGFILAELSDRILHLFMPIGPDLARSSAILSVLGHLILIVAFTFTISAYIRHARTHNLANKKIIVMVLCLLWPAMMIVLNFKVYSSWRDFYQYVDTTSAEMDQKVVSKMNSEMTGQKKSRLSYLHAQHIYHFEGRITGYQSPEGNALSYTPNAEDEEARRLVTFSQAHNKSNKIVMTMSSILYLLSFLGIIYFGFFAKKTP
jgi:small-conductance mechanosensitive channel